MARFGESGEKRLIYLISICIITALAFFVFFYSINAPSVRLLHKKASPMDSGWYYYSITGEQFSIDSLPTKLKDQGSKTRIYYKLSRPQNSFYLGFYSHHQNIKISFNSHLLYEYKVSNNPIWLSSFRSYYHIVKIPSSYGGEICIETEALQKKYEGEINPIYIGDQLEIINTILQQHSSRIILGIILELMGLFILTTALIFKSLENSSSALNFSLLMIFIGIWQMEESGIMQIFLGNQALHWICEYLIQILVLMVSYLFISNITPRKNSRILKFFFWGDLAVSGLLIALQITDIVQLNQSKILIQVMLLLTILYVIYLLFFRLNYVTQTVKILTAITLFISIILFSIVILKILPSTAADILMSIGLILTFAMFTVIVSKQILKNFESMKQTELYQKLAMIDLPTGVSSKTAWYTFVENFTLDKPDSKKDYCLILFDMNNLKKINDTFGHLEGDKAIKAFSYCLKSVFSAKGEIYRIGGDEFISICTNINEKTIKYLLSDFTALLDNQVETQFPITTAYGYSFFEAKDSKSILMAQDAADKEMYKMKKNMKESRSS